MQDKIAKMQEIARRGLQDQLPPEKRAIFDEASRRGLITVEATPSYQFGAGVHPSDLQMETEQDKGLRELAESTGPIQAGLIGFGKGIGEVAKGMNLGPEFGEFGDPNDQTQQQAMQALDTAHPVATTVGEVAGQSAPFVPMALSTGGVGALPTRIATQAGIGALEGGAIAKGTTRNPYFGAVLGGGVAGIAEMVLPSVGRAGVKLFRKITGKMPEGALVTKAGATPEFQAVLDEAGVTLDDLTHSEVLKMQKQGALDPAEIERLATFRQEGLTPTKAQVTRDAGDFQAQQEAAKTSSRVREMIEDQDATLTTRFSEAIERTGGEAATATSPVVDAIIGKASKLDSEISRLYKVARETAPGEQNVKFTTLGDKLRRLAPSDTRTGGNISAIVGELKSMGVIGDKMKVIGKVDVENAENVRKLMNSLYDPQNPYGNQVLRELKDSLDDDVFRTAGVDTFREARRAKATFESELSRAKVSKFDSRKSNLVRDVLENKIDPDRLVDNVIFAKKWRADDLQQLVDYVGKGQHLNDLKAEVLGTIKERVFTGAEDASGFKALGKGKLEKAIKDIGWDKINVLFSKEEADFLKRMTRIAQLREPVRGTALGKGPSAQAIGALEQKLKKLPIFGTLVDVIDVDTAGRAAIKAKPTITKPASDAARDITSSVTPLGVAGIAPENDRRGYGRQR